MSVIVDTGSHHTAFPCRGCNCGTHMDPFFDPLLSNTSVVCKGETAKCKFSQSYSEGSLWEAYRVRDRVYIGGFIRHLNKDVSFFYFCTLSRRS